ncbi:hypothetical protein BOX15_Mlig022366g2 [Macrostomum lignano]|uniref:Headcase middle domain-containing protein n=1 Tax=Macrostomum lignano TaxID=282301 RepID=A0A267FSP9_9PLAT|nr:hypothetical protein BOX15_Mlig022366g2 [Macrostomum lignano]
MSTSLQPRSNSSGSGGMTAYRFRPAGKLQDAQRAVENGLNTNHHHNQHHHYHNHQLSSVTCCLHSVDSHLLPPNQTRQNSAVISDPEECQDAVKLVCSGHSCGQVLWAHLDCLNRWERSAASGSHQKSASAMSPTQSVRGDQQKLLRCPCGKGQLVRDHSHPGSATAASQPQLIGRRRQQQTAGSNNGYYLMGSSGGGGVGSYNSPTDMLNKRLRNLSNSSSHGGFGAAFSLSPTRSETSTVPFTSLVYSQQPPPAEPALQHQLRNRGNIFRRRLDNFDSLKVLPRSKQNKFHIVTEDDSSTENDELKSLVLTTLTACRSPQVPCVLCGHQMPVYDHFPLIDGTFFLSPVRHRSSDGPACGKGFLHAVCLHCACRTRQPQLHSRCRYCQHTWDGSHLLVGGIYTFDVLACSPCCPERLLCSHCRRPLVTEPGDLPTAFSQFSQPLACPHCRTADFHFVRSVSLTCRGADGGAGGSSMATATANSAGTSAATPV